MSYLCIAIIGLLYYMVTRYFRKPYWSTPKYSKVQRRLIPVQLTWSSNSVSIDSNNGTFSFDLKKLIHFVKGLLKGANALEKDFLDIFKSVYSRDRMCIGDITLYVICDSIFTYIAMIPFRKAKIVLITYIKPPLGSSVTS